MARDVAMAIANRIRDLTHELNVTLAMAARSGITAELFSEVLPLVNVELSEAETSPSSGAADDGEYTGPTYTAYEFELRLKI